MTEIESPRPFYYYEDENPKGKRSIVLGTRTSGIQILVTKEGLEFNGYYAGFRENTKYATMRGFCLISWEDLAILKESLNQRTKRKQENVIMKEGLPDKIEEEVNEEYLKKLPIVTMNGLKFYIDASRRERRPVANPEHVFKFRTAFEGNE
jgi:hypothetical protein